MIRSIFKEVGEGYLKAKNSSYAGHSLAHFIRNEAPSKIVEIFGLDELGLIAKGSCGQGGWSEIPWFAILDPLVTTSTQKEYYIDILFSADMQSLYLCLGQGVTRLQEEFPGEWESILKQRALLIRTRIPEFKRIFPTHGLIDLGGNTSLAKSYRNTVAFYESYDLSNLPDEEVIRSHIFNMVELYQKLIFRGGIDLIETQENEEEFLVDQSIEEKKRFRVHKRIEGRIDSKKIKKAHGYICQGCGFSFEEKYGDLGKDFIEAHHLIPFKDLEEGASRKLSIANDFAVLCANCHRMIHRFKEPHNLEAFKKKIAS